MSVARDSAVLLVSEGASAVLTIATGVIIARLLPVDAFGRFAAAFAFAGLLSVAAESGMGILAGKEVATGSDEARRRLREIFTWRLLMIALAAVVGPFIAPIALSRGDARVVGAWLAPAVMLVGLSDFFEWILKGRRRVAAAAGIQAGTRAVLVGLCVAVLLRWHALRPVLGAFWISGLAVLVAGPLLVRAAGYSLRPVRLGRAFFRETFPNVTKIGMVILLSVAFTRLDVLLVSGMLGAVAAGLFGAAARVVDAMQMVPTVANGVLLPRFTALRGDAPAFRRQFRSAFAALLALSVGLAAVASLAAEPLVVLVLGEPYRDSVPLLRPLLWSAVPMFLNMLGFSALYALHDHRTLVAGIAVALAVELAVDGWLLPRMGAVAASWSRLGAEVLNFLILARALAARGMFSVAAPAEPALVAGRRS